MENKCLLGLIFLSCINRCIAQSIQTINDCTCRTSDGNFYSLWPFRGTEKPRYVKFSFLLSILFLSDDETIFFKGLPSFYLGLILNYINHNHGEWLG